MRARTVHSALGWIPGEGPTHDEQDPLPCDLLIVDETLDGQPRAAGHAAAGGRPEAHVVLVGDADQLAPVGAGKPFAELVASGAVPTARLTHIFRQAAGSMIVQGAHAIRRGAAPDFTAAEGMRRDLFLIERANPQRGARGDRVAGQPPASGPLRHRSGARHPGVRAGVPGRPRDRRAQRGVARGRSTPTASRCAAAACGSATS